jgi:hypothetical protein
MADSFDPDKQKFSEKSKEPICPGDVTHYYCPIFVSGDPRGLHETSVLAVDPNDKFPLVLSNGDGLPSTTQVKCIKVYRNNIPIEHCGLFCEVGRFILKKRGIATAADGASMQARTFDVIMKKHIIKGMEKANADGFAPVDMLINKFNCGVTRSAPAIVDTIQYRKRQSMKENCTLDTSENVFPHKSETEALLILRRCGKCLMSLEMVVVVTMPSCYCCVE